MSEEVLIPKMRRIDSKKKKGHMSVLNLAFVLFSFLLLVMSTFISISIKHYILPSEFWHNSNSLISQDFIYCFCIIPQIPILMFICSMFGKKLAMTSVVLYIIIGLTALPVFALGGGISYIGEYSLGYILAYIPAVLIAGQFLKIKYSFLNMFWACLCAVLIIHIFGMLYMILIALLRHDSLSFIGSWLAAQSGLKIIYDLIFSYILVLIGKYINAFIKFILN